MSIASQKRRVGIFAGTFDPVHSGHISFALQAVENATLDEVLFLPERRPRAKPSAEHYGHRVAMLRRALAPHSQLDLLELVEARFDVQRTLSHLRAVLGDAELVFLAGSDIVSTMPTWPHLSQLCQQAELVVGVRASETPEEVQFCIESWPVQPRNVTLFESFAPVVSSSYIRSALRMQQSTAGLLRSVQRYSEQNWLYVALPE